MALLLLADKLGITEGYRGIWESMCQKAGIDPGRIIHKSVWRDPEICRLPLLEKRGNRKTPGFNTSPGIQSKLKNWLNYQINKFNPEMIICMDMALLGLVEPAWDSATIDNLRGGIYYYEGRIPFYIMTPISAVHAKKSNRDIALMNKGVYSKDAWDALHLVDDDSERDSNLADDTEDEPDDVWVEPYTIELGRWILRNDLSKLQRILQSVHDGSFRSFRPQIYICQTASDAREAESFLLSSSLIANDIETLPKDGLVTVNGYTGLKENGDKRTFVFPYYVDKNFRLGTQPDLEAFLDVSFRVNDSGIPFTFQNGGYDLFWHLFYGMPVRNYALDSMTMFWSLYPELPKRLDFISSILLTDYHYWKGARKSDNFNTFLIYNGLDCDRTLDDTVELVSRLNADPKATQNFWHAHMRVLYSLGMSVKGVKSDELVRLNHKAVLELDAGKTLAALQYLVANRDFNPNSPQQKAHLLYDVLGIRMRTAKGRYTTDRKKASTGAVPLRSMRNEHPIFRRVVNGIMDALTPSKQISNVIGLSRAQWTPTNIRFHTGYNGVGTDTTRLSSSGSPINISGNLQNIRKDYRNIIKADDDSILLDIDFSAADDVFVSFESSDPKKIELQRTGKDTHAVNTTIFFTNWTYEQVIAGKKAKYTDPELYKKITHPITGIRQITKKLSHGCNYLMAGLTLLMTAGREAIVAAAKELGYADAGLWSQDRLVDFCERLEGLYRSHYTRFKRSGKSSWYTDLKTELVQTGGFTSAFNYYQRFLGDSGDEGVLRAVAASAGQANTAGRVNAAVEELIFGRISPRFRDAENPAFAEKPLQISRAAHGINLHLQNHDSLTFGVLLSHPNWEEGVDRIFRVMERPVHIRNKLTRTMEEFTIGRETEIGINWGPGLHEVKSNNLAAVKDAIKELGYN